MEIKIPKTKVLQVGGPADSVKIPVQIAGETLEDVSAFKYLGSTKLQITKSTKLQVAIVLTLFP